MNKDRRKQIEELVEKFGPLEDLVSELKEAVEGIRDEEQEYYDNMPEALQNSERGERAQEAIDNLDSVVQGLDDIYVSGWQDELRTAAE